MIEDIDEPPGIENFKRIKEGFEFNLSGISTKISVKTKNIKKTGKVAFLQSHFIHTPKQCDKYETDVQWAWGEIGAIERVLGDFSRFYNIAIEADEIPNDSWLELNTNYFVDNWK